MSRKLSIILRGHIRNSFADKQLYNYIKDLSNEYDLTIYIQTWNILQTNVSWRYLEKNETPVNEEFIYNYFEDLSGNIKKIIILDDTKIVLTGITKGRMGKTSGSYLGWKQMWYGIYEIAKYVKKKNSKLDTFIINTRFDLFNNSVSFSESVICDKLNIVMNSPSLPHSINKNIFLKNIEFFGLDNFYIGNAKTIFDLAERFKFHLDEIVIKYPRVKSHEFYTFHVNNTLFLENWLNNLVSTNGQLIDGPNSDVKVLVNSNSGTRSTEPMNIHLFKSTKNSNYAKIISQEEISKSVSDRNITLLPVSKSSNNQIQLYESNIDVNTNVSLLSSSTNNLSITEDNLNEEQNSMILPPRQSKHPKLSFLDPNLSDAFTTNQPTFNCSNLHKKGSISLIDSTTTSMSSINSNEINLPISSTNSTRSSVPLINTSIASLDVNNNLGIKMTNNNTRNNRSQMNMTKKGDTMNECPKKPDDKIQPHVVEVKSSQPSIKKVTTIKQPVPISKFYVTLDPNYLDYSNSITNAPLPDVKLIHSDKFKTNTQSLSAYYALLSR
jgi:hypothetical protein